MTAEAYLILKHISFSLFYFFLNELKVQNAKAATRGVLENFTKFNGKHLCHSLFLNKVLGIRPETLLKKQMWPIEQFSNVACDDPFLFIMSRMRAVNCFLLQTLPLYFNFENFWINDRANQLIIYLSKKGTSKKINIVTLYNNIRRHISK